MSIFLSCMTGSAPSVIVNNLASPENNALYGLYAQLPQIGQIPASSGGVPENWKRVWKYLTK